jgi:hypothetical protein
MQHIERSTVAWWLSAARSIVAQLDASGYHPKTKPGQSNAKNHRQEGCYPPVPRNRQIPCHACTEAVQPENHGAYEYEKTEQAYKRLGEILNTARRARLIDMDMIRDDGFARVARMCFGLFVT